jgi:hypothetical protein
MRPMGKYGNVLASRIGKKYTIACIRNTNSFWICFVHAVFPSGRKTAFFIADF